MSADSQTPLPGREPAAGDHTEAAEHGSVGAAGPTTPAGQGTHQVRGAANTTEKAQILMMIEAHLSTGLGCRCGAWKIDTSQRPVDPRAQHREHVAEMLAARSARKPEVNECPDCGQIGRYDRRVTVAGRGIYTCPNHHRWQDAAEDADAKGYVVFPPGSPGAGHV